MKSMLRIYGNGIKLVLWTAVSLLFVSHNVSYKDEVDYIDLDGTYALRTAGAHDLELNGRINFESALEVTANGSYFATLKLNLESSSKDRRHSMGFLISKQDRAKPIGAGTYRISRDIDGFLNRFDGVFGFANIEADGELPYFATRGKVGILRLTKNKLRGSIDIELENANGKQLIIRGDFTAVPNIN